MSREIEERYCEAMIFTCPNCGDPAAQTVEPDVDIHAGATYHCGDCGGRVIFEALTVAEYTTRANLLARVEELEAALRRAGRKSMEIRGIDAQGWNEP